MKVYIFVKKFLCFFTLSFLTACTSSREFSADHGKEQIIVSLDKMLKRSNDDAFVIFIEKKTQKFVQFRGNDRESLMLNLPEQTLDNHELEKAKTLFKQYRVKLGKNPGIPVGPDAGIDRSFDMEIGKDTKKGADIAMEVFREVYGFQGNFIIETEEN